MWCRGEKRLGARGGENRCVENVAKCEVRRRVMGRGVIVVVFVEAIV